MTSRKDCYVYDAGMEAWLRVADAAFPASEHHSLLPGLAGPSELSRLSAEAAAAAGATVVRSVVAGDPQVGD